MSNRVANRVAKRVRSARIVLATLEEHGAEISAGVSSGWSSLLAPSETMPDIKLLLTLMHRGLARSTDALVAADAAHEAELSDDVQARDERDAAEADLRMAIVAARTGIEGVCGRPTLTEVGLGESAPIGPEGLVTYTGGALASMRKVTKPLTPVMPGLTAPLLPELASALETKLGRLTRALDVVAKEKREATTTMLRRNEALANFESDFVRIVGLVEQLAKVAGLTELAKRVRPSTREPGVLDALPDDTTGTDTKGTDTKATDTKATDTKPSVPVDPNRPNNNPFG